jgi:hypothetical protein
MHRPPIVLNMPERTRFDVILDDLLELDEAGALEGIRAIIAMRLRRVRAGLDKGYAPGGLTAAAQAEIRASLGTPTRRPVACRAGFRAYHRGRRSVGRRDRSATGA